MADRLRLIAGCAAMMGVMYVCVMRASPARGWLKAAERMTAGIILCYLCHIALRPFGISIPQNPISALAAGFLGLPGVALAAGIGQ